MFNTKSKYIMVGGSQGGTTASSLCGNFLFVTLKLRYIKISCRVFSPAVFTEDLCDDKNFFFLSR